MDTLRLKPRAPAPDVESWDDDDFLIEGDDLTISSHSSAVNVGSNRRESTSSFRSELESAFGEEERHVHLPGDDEKSTLDAIAAAAKAGIPIPTNVPPSALTGGTIKRLGGRKLKKIIQEDWCDDLELPAPGQALRIKQQDGSRFPEVLRQVSNPAQLSPVKPSKPFLPSIIYEGRPAKPINNPPPRMLAINLDQFRDVEKDEDVFGDSVATIKVSRRREVPKLIPLITPLTPAPQKDEALDESFEDDFDLPSDGKLTLSKRRDIPKTPHANPLDDLDWTEGSLGTRFGGTRRDGRSQRSSSTSALSPSVTSSNTLESEDEVALDGLVLPEGPLDFGKRLMRRRISRSPERIEEEPAKEDFLDGLELGDGDVFPARKPSLHRNVQVKETRPVSPSRPKTAVALKFTTKLMPGSRLPRPMGPMASHDRTHAQSSLEPVWESGGPTPRTRRSLSRLGHCSQSSVSSLTTPTTSSPMQTFPPATPRRHDVNQKSSSTSQQRNEPTTTSAQLLRFKRSLPTMGQSPARPMSSRANERPPSRTDISARAQSGLRPKTPVDRIRSGESAAAQARKPAVPWVSAGGSASHPHNIIARSSRSFRRHESNDSTEFRPSSRAVSRSTIRSPSPRKHRQVGKIAQEAWQRLHRPRRSGQFGDGNELDGFDDLPTSTQAEAKFMKQPVPGVRPQLRNKIHQNAAVSERTSTPSPLIPCSPARVEHVPSFARDTAASRMAREASLAHRTGSAGPHAPLTTQRVAQLSARSNLNPNLPASTIRAKKLRKAPQLKPHLISNLNPPKESKVLNGMFYNPETYLWEGNDHALRAFDPPASSPSTVSVPPFLARDRDTSTPRPALITNIGATKGVQVVGGMVFDPQNMRWLQCAPQPGKTERGDAVDAFDALDDENDVFKDIPDLEDRAGNTEAGHGRVSDMKDDWLVGEEFDVGPAFIKRQREEEERWRKKCTSWFSGQQVRDDSWKWRIREIVNLSVQD